MPMSALVLALAAIRHVVLLGGVGTLATAMNTVAGSGSFPALIALGVSSAATNAANAFALTFGSVGGVETSRAGIVCYGLLATMVISSRAFL